MLKTLGLLLLAVAAVALLSSCASTRTVTCTDYKATMFSPAKTVCEETDGPAGQATGSTQTANVLQKLFSDETAFTRRGAKYPYWFVSTAAIAAAAAFAWIWCRYPRRDRQTPSAGGVSAREPSSEFPRTNDDKVGAPSGEGSGMGRSSCGQAGTSLWASSGVGGWSPNELAGVRAALESDVVRLREEIALTEQDIKGARGSGGSASGATTLDLEHEASMAGNAQDMLQQTERAIARIDNGAYGECEACGGNVGKLRLQAFPRATLCLGCKELMEKRQGSSG